ncbi:hypothetical protein D5R81_01990 [Parashewanella spongiae]|uniref:Uncharacterized protein n=1 Tax=Parashewanella spongiae TaxID=342950 RepID=A0A3A6TXE1_9GAMM|nr:hypothetical protein [Parashewanella spongiae]MCL1076897.1 hypothetical protein [Parashewanella spongiae]RJY19147.1 hypothetical protein D5R81_01990 [Parashewanella spongiae]
MLFISAVAIGLIVSGALIGFSAYYSGMAVKRWGLAGLLLGPAAYPLFNAHKQLANRKVVAFSDVSVIC